MNDVSNTVLVGFDYSKDDASAVLIVGKRSEGNPINIINMFQGQEAIDLWAKLTIMEGKK